MDNNLLLGSDAPRPVACMGRVSGWHAHPAIIRGREQARIDIIGDGPAARAAENSRVCRIPAKVELPWGSHEEK